MLTRSLMLLVCASLSCAAVEVQVIANKEIGLTAMQENDLSDYFLGKKTRLPGGQKATILTNGDRDETERFLDRYLDQTPARFSASWKRMVFTGRGIPPTEAKDDQDMIALVKKTPGAIGYVALGAAVDGVLVLSITK
jgi:ABC-type phosphate transport system substrate-binding protein